MRKKTWLSVLLAAIMVLTMLPSAVFAADGSTGSEEPDGTAVAQVGEDTYTSLQKAVDDVKNGETITLLADINGLDTVMIDPGKTITIDGAGKTITLSGNSAFNYIGENNLEGLQSNTKLTVNNVVFKGSTEGQSGHAAVIGHNASNVQVAFSGCTFNDMYDAVYCNQVVAADATPNAVTITGCTFNNVANYYGVDDGATPGARVDKLNVTLENNTGEADIETFAVASVDGVGYTDLDAALDIAETGNTVTLMKDIAVDSKISLDTAGIIFDLGGHMITASEEFAYDEETPSNSHLVDVVADSITVKNGIIETGANNRHALNVYDSENIRLEDLVLNHTTANSGAPLVVGASDVAVSGYLELITGENSWYAANVDSRMIGGTPTGSLLHFNDGAQIRFSGEKVEGIYIENTAEVEKDKIGVDFGENVAVASEIPGFVAVYAADAIKDSITIGNPEGAGLVENENGYYVPEVVEEPSTTPGADNDATVPSGDKADNAPKTGDDSNMVIPFVAAGIALAAMGVVVATRRRHS